MRARLECPAFHIYHYIISVEFDNYMQQDAHEFLNFLINHINEIIIGKEWRLIAH